MKAAQTLTIYGTNKANSCSNKINTHWHFFCVFQILYFSPYRKKSTWALTIHVSVVSY